MWGANVPAIQSNGDRGLRRRDIVRGPFLGARLGILLGQKIPFASSGYPMSVTTDTIAINLSVERQYILEQSRCHAIGHEGGPLALQVKSFRQRSVWESRGQRAKAFPPGAAISLHPPTTKTRCVPVSTPASASSTVTSMRIDHLRCPGTAGIYATIVAYPTIRNDSRVDSSRPRTPQVIYAHASDSRA